MVGLKAGTIFSTAPGDVAIRFPGNTTYYLDHCMTYGASCDKPAADQFCHKQGLGNSVNSSSTIVGPNDATLMIQQTGRQCGPQSKTGEVCTAFTQIVCGALTVPKYLGCYVDTSARILPFSFPGNGLLTNAICEQECQEKGYTLAGTEYTWYCFCGNSSAGAVLAPNSDCNSACSGNGTEICGGGWRLTINDLTGIKMSTGKYIGCYVDGGTRTLPYSLGVVGGLTPATCQRQCQSKGYQLAGTEYSNQCYCGNSTALNAAVLKPDSDCNTACAGDNTVMCGGGWRLSMYDLTGM